MAGLTFGQKLRLLRRSTGRTQVEVAAELGRAQSSYSSLEQRADCPSPVWVGDLVTLFGVPSDFFEWDDEDMYRWYREQRPYLAEAQRVFLVGETPNEGSSARVTCKDCGLPYAEFGLDTTIPNGQWELINPNDEGGVLCANCMIKRAAKFPAMIAARMVFEIHYRKDKN